MAQLDYAMLAEFARVDPAGLLTVVGGGFDRVRVNSPGLVHQVFLVMRFKLDDDERTVPFQVAVVPPDEPQFEMKITGIASANPSAQTAPGNFGAFSVLSLGLPITSSGRYLVQVRIGESLVRELPFEVELLTEAAS